MEEGCGRGVWSGNWGGDRGRGWWYGFSDIRFGDLVWIWKWDWNLGIGIDEGLRDRVVMGVGRT